MTRISVGDELVARMISRVNEEKLNISACGQTYFNGDALVLGISPLVNGDGRLGMGADLPRGLLNKAVQLNCSTLIEGHARSPRNTAIMRDVVAVLSGTPFDQIADRTPTGEKNTFRLGFEPEDDDSDRLGEDRQEQN
jgi:hypothetical protein